MARSVKCKLCKTKGDTDIFYKVVEGDKNKYYCSKAEYDAYIDDKNKRECLMRYIAIEVLDYREGQIIPPVLQKKIGEMNNFYDYEVIQECFAEKKDTIQYWIRNKDFKNEYGMISYIIKIIEGSINDIYKKWKYKQRQRQKHEDNNVDLGILNQIEDTQSTRKKTTSIMDFLGEDDI